MTPAIAMPWTTSTGGCAAPAGQAPTFLEAMRRDSTGDDGSLPAWLEPGPDERLNEARRSIDALVQAAHVYTSSSAFLELMNFLRGFRNYSPFNGLLVHVQQPGSSYVQTAERWLDQYRRGLRPGARPLAILQPFGPVMFVYDVADTDPREGAPTLPLAITSPFSVTGSTPQAQVDAATEHTIANAVRDGVATASTPSGAHAAGRIERQHGHPQAFLIRMKPERVHVEIATDFQVHVSSRLTGLARYATLAHELGHLYCGHLGTTKAKAWPDRRGLDHATVEFEAELVSALAVWRLDPNAVVPPYLHQHLQENGQVPGQLSISRVLAAAELIIKMAEKRMGLRPVKSP